jgi:hypothetical protein
MINGSTTPLRFRLMKAERDLTRRCIDARRSGRAQYRDG